MKISELKKVIESSVRNTINETIPKMYEEEILPAIDSIVEEHIKNINFENRLNENLSRKINYTPKIKSQGTNNTNEDLNLNGFDLNQNNIQKNTQKNNINSMIDATELSREDLSGIK